jgi:hypothetical protein
MRGYGHSCLGPERVGPVNPERVCRAAHLTHRCRTARQRLSAWVALSYAALNYPNVLIFYKDI